MEVEMQKGSMKFSLIMIYQKILCTLIMLHKSKFIYVHSQVAPITMKSVLLGFHLVNTQYTQ